MRRVSISVRWNDMLNKYYKSAISGKNVTNVHVHYRSLAKYLIFKFVISGIFWRPKEKNLNNFFTEVNSS